MKRSRDGVEREGQKADVYWGKDDDMGGTRFGAEEKMALEEKQMGREGEMMTWKAKRLTFLQKRDMELATASSIDG